MKWSDLIDIYENKTTSKDPYYKYAIINYRKLIEKLKDNDPEDEVTDSKIDKLDITDHMKNKLREIIKTNAKPIKHPENIREELLKILGIGSIKADELIKAGVKKMDDLKKSKFAEMLPEGVRTMLNLQPERKIPHETIKRIEPLLMSLCDRKTGCVNTLIAGSYKRRMPFSRDIDIIVVGDDNVLKNWLSNAQKIFGESLHVISSGDDKLSTIIEFGKLETYKAGTYKIDVFKTDINTAHALILYATGSKEHNILMRGIAKSKGMLLNDKGLFDRKTGRLIKTTSERDIFEKLGMEYKEPWERI